MLSTEDEIVIFASDLDWIGFVTIHACILFDSSLSHISCRLYCILVWYAQNKDFLFPGIDELCVDLGEVSKRTVRTALIELKESGLISVQSRYNKIFYIVNSIGDKYGKGKRLSRGALDDCNFKYEKNNGISKIVRKCGCCEEEDDSFLQRDQKSEQVKETKKTERKKEKVLSKKVLSKKINIKEVIDQIPDVLSDRNKKSREQTMLTAVQRDSNAPEGREAIKELKIFWGGVWERDFSDIPGDVWVGKQNTIVKSLLARYGFNDVKRLFQYVFDNWVDLRSRFKLNRNHAPTLGLISVYADNWIQEVYRGKPDLDKKGVNKNEYNKGEGEQVQLNFIKFD